MTEIEKLRALLAEARVALQGVAAYDASPDVSWTLTKEFCRDALDLINAEYEKANASDLTRDALALQNASLLHKLVDTLKVSEDENKKLIAALNKARADAIMLRSALNKYFKPSLPYAQWSNEEHQVEIVLDKTEQYK